MSFVSAEATWHFLNCHQHFSSLNVQMFNGYSCVILFSHFCWSILWHLYLVKNPRTGYISPAKALVMLSISKGLFSFFSHNHTLTFDQSKVGEICADLWPPCYPLWSHIDLSTQTAQNCLALSYSLMLRISSAGLHPCSLCSLFC